MAIIDLTYLTKIPNLSFEATGGIADSDLNNNDEVTNAIDRYEMKFLVDALGKSVTAELYDQFESDGSWKATALQKYKDLVDGDETVNWDGLRYSIGNNKISMIANYVFCQILLNKGLGDLTELGVSISNVEQSTVVSEAPMVATYWNELVGWRNFDRCHYYKKDRDQAITLEEYLEQSEEFTLDNFIYSDYVYVNRYEI